MARIEELRSQLPEPARDIRLNLQSVFQTTSLTPAQLWGTAVATAIATRNPRVAEAVIADARAHVGPEVIEDAQAAAAVMAMNNVYYRFRHMSGKEAYNTRPARLRMNAIGKPRGNKADFELFCLAVSAINGCEMCIRSHEQVILDHGLTEDQVHDAVRTAATMLATAVSLEMAPFTLQATDTATA